MKKIIFISLIFFVFTGCGSGLRRPRVLKGVVFSEGTRHEIYTDIKKRQESLQSLKGIVRLKWGKAFFKGRGEVAFVVKDPYWLRMEGLGDFGLPSTQFVIDRGFFTVYWADRHQYFKGMSTREEINSHLGFLLSDNELLNVVMAKVELSEEKNYRLMKSAKTANWVLKSEDNEIEVIQIGKKYVPQKYTSYHLNGDGVYIVYFSDYQEFQSFYYPKHIRVDFKEPKVRVDMDYESIDINPSISNKVFKLDIPGDALEYRDY